MQYGHTHILEVPCERAGARALTRPSWNSSSTISLSSGSSPEWCTPMPFFSSGSIFATTYRAPQAGAHDSAARQQARAPDP